MELRNAISAEFSMDVPVTLAFDYPTQSALADFVAGRLGRSRGEVGLRSKYLLPVAQSGSQSQTSEVVGLACRYPRDVTGRLLPIPSTLCFSIDFINPNEGQSFPVDA